MWKGSVFVPEEVYYRDYKFGMENCKPFLMSVDINYKLRQDVGLLLEDVTMYRKLVRSLIYLALTRPNIAYAVGVVNRFMHNLRKPQLEVARCVLRYIKGRIDFWILYEKGI